MRGTASRRRPTSLLLRRCFLNIHDAHNFSGHDRPPHRRAAGAALRQRHDRHQRGEDRPRNRRDARHGVALDRKTPRARRPREGPSAHRLSDRKSAGHPGAEDSAQAAAAGAVRKAHPPFLQDGFDQLRRHDAGRAAENRTERSSSPRSRRRGAAAPGTPGTRKKRTGFT